MSARCTDGYVLRGGGFGLWSGDAVLLIFGPGYGLNCVELDIIAANVIGMLSVLWMYSGG